MARTAASAKPLTDHNEIRRWAEERDAKPACVRRTGSDDDIGMIRLDFPGYSGGESLEAVSWDEWFDKFDENNLALLVQDTTARGQQSNFNKLVSRQTASGRARGTSGRTRATSGGRSRAKSAATRSRATGKSRSTGRSRKASTASSRRTGATAKKSVASARKTSNSRSGSRHRRAA